MVLKMPIASLLLSRTQAFDSPSPAHESAPHLFRWGGSRTHTGLGGRARELNALEGDVSQPSRSQEQAGFSLKGSPFFYGAVAIGVLVGAAFSTYLWRQRVRALNLLQTTPLERAEQIISNCEDKLEAIERAIDDLKAARLD